LPTASIDRRQGKYHHRLHRPVLINERRRQGLVSRSRTMGSHQRTIAVPHEPWLRIMVSGRMPFFAIAQGVTRNVRWEYWDHPHKSKLTDPSLLFTKVEGLNKEQKVLLEKAIDKFIINNKMCPSEFIAKNARESTNSGKLMITNTKSESLNQHRKEG
jgi:hypothetical protein